MAKIIGCFLQKLLQVGVFYKRLIQGQACEIVYNVAQYLRNMRTEHNLLFNLVEETSQATCVG